MQLKMHSAYHSNFVQLSQKQFVSWRSPNALGAADDSGLGLRLKSAQNPHPPTCHCKPAISQALSATFRLFFSLQPSATVIYATLQLHSGEICNRRGSQGKTEGLFMGRRVNFWTKSSVAVANLFFVCSCYQLRGINCFACSYIFASKEFFARTVFNLLTVIGNFPILV